MNKIDLETEEINITPLVDVFIILMTIFIALSVLYKKTNIHHEKINTPEINKENIFTQDKKSNYLFIYKNLNIKINNHLYSYKKFLKLKNITFDKKHQEIIIVADENIKYKYIINIMSKLNDLKYKNINLELRIGD